MTDDGGLRFTASDDDALATLRRQAMSMSRNLHVEMDRGTGFPLDAPDLTGMSGGLLAADDPEALDRLLRDQRDREANLRLRRTLDSAERAAERKEFDAAVGLVDRALEIDRTSVSAWLLRGRCLMATGDVVRARQSIAVAREHAGDPAETRLADALAAACDKQEMSRFVGHLDALVAQGRVADALRQVEDRLAERPDDPSLLQNRCALLLLSGDTAAARRVAERARGAVAAADAGRFEELLRTVARRECEPRIREARHALRRRDTGTAVARLDECVAALGDDAKFRVLLAYARQRHAGAASNGLVRMLRGRRNDAPPVSPEDLRWLLDWLLQEELDAGWADYRAGRYRAAQQRFAAAAAIDDRSARVAYLHAAALFTDLVVRLTDAGAPDLDETRRMLERARELLATCVHDRVEGEGARELAGTVDQFLDVVRRVQAQIARTKEINDCVARFNSLMSQYQRSPIRTTEQRDLARRRFGAITRRVAVLRRERSADPGEDALLRELDEALARVRGRLGGW